MLGVLTLGACGGGGNDAESGGEDSGPPAAGEVVIERFSFMPEDGEGPAGTTGTWTNQDSAAHSVEDEGGLFPESEGIPQGEEFSFTYDTPGEYPYICGIHPYMTATVTVT
ncbi:cupredoxin family copper-binding protein [soil metagenome]